ncbi:MAG: hypothetical protein E6G56_10935 [Actinobacteria bacterium]|nr:MAG: hypothetical protein E6G56_10935 [Actinomycetota bacterium]
MAKRGTRADALRSAVDQTFQAAAGQAQTTRDLAQDLVDELAQTAGRLRGALEDFRPPSSDDLRSVRDRLRALERRVAALEKSQKGASSRPGRRAARSPSGKAARAGAAKAGRSPRSRPAGRPKRGS